MLVYQSVATLSLSTSQLMDAPAQVTLSQTSSNPTQPIQRLCRSWNIHGCKNILVPFFMSSMPGTLVEEKEIWWDSGAEVGGVFQWIDVVSCLNKYIVKPTRFLPFKSWRFFGHSWGYVTCTGFHFLDAQHDMFSISPPNSRVKARKNHRPQWWFKFSKGNFYEITFQSSWQSITKNWLDLIIWHQVMKWSCTFDK